VRPLGIGPGERVLVFGAGSGVLVRHAADAGASVVGFESDPGWMAAARLRVEGCDAVELTDVLPPESDQFDVVIIAASPEASPLPLLGEMLSDAAKRVATGGVVAVAVPSAVSVAQLSGFKLPDLAGVSTGMGLPELIAEFEASGLEVGAPIACYPDVFGAMAMITEKAFAVDDAVAFVDQLVGAPVSGLLGRPFALADDRALLRAIVEAGAGPITAPGVLLVGGRSSAAGTARLGLNTLAWRFTGGRAQAFQQELAISAGPAGRVAERNLVYPWAADSTSTWIRHSLAPEQPYTVGENLEQQALRAMAAGDLATLNGSVTRWAVELEAVSSTRPDSPSHPFLPAESARVLPPDHLDVGLDNFTDSDSGLVFIDREWRCRGGVDLDLAVTRAIWKVSISTVRNGSRHPWAAEATVAEIWAHLVELSPFQLRSESLAVWWAAEAQLMAEVTGAAPEATADELQTIASRSRIDRAVYPAGVEAAGALQNLDSQITSLTDQLTNSHARNADLEEERDAMAQRLEELRSMLPIRAARAVANLRQSVRLKLTD
jgi:hypothetical protein